MKLINAMGHALQNKIVSFSFYWMENINICEGFNPKKILLFNLLGIIKSNYVNVVIDSLRYYYFFLIYEGSSLVLLFLSHLFIV